MSLKLRRGSGGGGGGGGTLQACCRAEVYPLRPQSDGTRSRQARRRCGEPGCPTSVDPLLNN